MDKLRFAGQCAVILALLVVAVLGLSGRTAWRAIAKRRDNQSEPVSEEVAHGE